MVSWPSAYCPVFKIVHASLNRGYFGAEQKTFHPTGYTSEYTLLDVLVNVPLSTIVQYVAPELFLSQKKVAFETKMDADLWSREFKFPNECNPFVGNPKFCMLNNVRQLENVPRHTALAELGIPSNMDELAFNLQLLSMTPSLLYRNTVRSPNDAANVVWHNTDGEPFDAEECLDPYGDIPHKQVSFKPMSIDMKESSMQEYVSAFYKALSGHWENWNTMTRGNNHGRTLSAVSLMVEGDKRTLLVNFTHRLWLKDEEMKELVDMFKPTHVVLRLREDLRGAEDSGCTWLDEGDSSQKLVLHEARRKGWDVDG
jgi:hypothetical protein